jgi:hypothetical protein
MLAFIDVVSSCVSITYILCFLVYKVATATKNEEHETRLKANKRKREMSLLLETQRKRCARLKAKLLMAEQVSRAAEHKWRNEVETMSLEMERLWLQWQESEQRMNNKMLSCGRGRPLSLDFEHFVRTILATGSSGRAARDSILSSAAFFLPEHTYDTFQPLVPQLRWFQQQREALGNESWLYSMVR